MFSNNLLEIDLCCSTTCDSNKIKEIIFPKLESQELIDEPCKLIVDGKFIGVFIPSRFYGTSKED
jgi:hypothetical protein